MGLAETIAAFEETESNTNLVTFSTVAELMMHLDQTATAGDTEYTFIVGEQHGTTAN